MAITAEMTTSVMELYTAYFNRAADKDGVDYWLNEMDTKAWTIDQVAQSFADQTEYTAIYAGLTNAQIVAQVYTNVLGRTADTAGAAYWEAELDGGIVPVSQFIQAVVNAAKEDVDNLGDDDIVANKTAVSQYYYDNNRNDTDVSLAAVTTDTATVDTAKAALDAVINAGSTFTLTTGTETVTGTALNDTIDGVTSSLSSARTLDTTDVIDGGEGTDTFNITMNSSFTGFTTGSVTNVENIALTNASTVARTFDATGITGATAYSIDGTTGGISTLSDMSSIADITLINQQSNFTTAMDSTFVALAGTADAMNLSVENVGTVADATATPAVAEVSVTATLANMETVNLELTGANVVSVAGTLTTLNVAGAGSVKMNSLAASVTSFDASEATGNVTVDTTAATALTTIATGAGDDTVTFTKETAAANATLSGGAGTDTLTYNTGATADTVQYNMSGFETLALNTIHVDGLTFSGTNVSDITTVSTNVNTAGATSLVNMGAIDLTVNAIGGTVDAGDLSSTHTGATTLNYTATAAQVTAKTAVDSAADFTLTGTTDLTVNVNEYISTTGTVITAANATALTLNVASGKSSATTPVEQTDFDGAITAAAATSFTANIEGKVTATGAITLAAATDATITNGTTAGAMQLAAAALENLTVTTGNTLDMSTSTLSAVQVLDATVAKGTFTTGALADISSLTVAGSGTTSGSESTAVFGALGADNAYNLSVVADGLKGGFTTTTVDTGTGYDINIDASSVTGAISITDVGSIVTDSDAVTITTAGTAVDIDTVTAAGNITITNTSSGTFDLEDVSAGTTGNVTVTLDGTIGAVTIDTLTGNNVTLNAANTIGGFTWAAAGTTDITAKSSATVVLSELQDNNLDLLAAAGSTTFTGTVTGGIGADALTFTSVVTSTAMVLTGDLDIGTDTLTVDLDTNDHIATSTVNLSGLLNVDTTTVDLSATVALAGLTLTTGSNVETIQWNGAVKTTMTGFDTTEDKLSFDNVDGAAGIATSGTAIAAGAAIGTVTDAAVYVFADGATAIATGSEVIADYTDLTDVAAYIAEAFSDEAAGDDFVAVINDLVGDKSYAYYVDFDAGAGATGAIDIDAMTLIGVITEESGAALVAGDIA